MTFNCDLDLESAWLLWVLHISLKWTFKRGENFQWISWIQRFWWFFEKLKVLIMTQAFEIWYFCGGRVRGMDIFSDFVELSFPSLIQPNFNENPSRSKRDMERTQNSRLNPMTFNFDLDLESAWLSNGFCTLSHWGEHFTKVEWNPYGGKGDMEWIQTSRLNLVIFSCDIDL